MVRTDKWVCKECGYSRHGDEDGFRLLGNGLVECPKCDTIYVVTFSGELTKVRQKEVVMSAERRFGFTEDWFGQATIRVEIVTETTDGRYVLKKENTGLFLRPKEEVKLEYPILQDSKEEK